MPLSKGEMHTLLSSMQQMLSHTTDSAQQLLIVRDGLLLSILWQTCYRGFNAGGIRLDNIVLPTGGRAFLTGSEPVPMWCCIALVARHHQNQERRPLY